MKTVYTRTRVCTCAHVCVRLCLLVGARNAGTSGRLLPRLAGPAGAALRVRPRQHPVLAPYGSGELLHLLAIPHGHRVLTAGNEM